MRRKRLILALLLVPLIGGLYIFRLYWQHWNREDPRAPPAPHAPPSPDWNSSEALDAPPGIAIRRTLAFPEYIWPDDFHVQLKIRFDVPEIPRRFEEPLEDGER